MLDTPEHRQSIAREEFSQEAITLSRSSFFPSLNLVGGVAKADTEWFPNKTETWNVGLNLSIPIFSGGHDYYSLQSSSATYRSSILDRIQVDQTQWLKIQQAYHTLVESHEKLKVDENFLKAAVVRAEIARKKYNNGLTTFEDWDLIENDLINRQKNVLQSKRDRVIAEAAFEQVCGKAVFQ